MSTTYNAGIVTAYGSAVRAGYTGTYDQWCTLMASYATVAEAAAQSAAEAAASAQAIQDMGVQAGTLPAGSTATVTKYVDPDTGAVTLSFGIPRGDKGDKGDTGNGIASAVLNPDYTLTLTFTNGQTYTTPSIRGATGATGNGISSIYKTSTLYNVNEYTILYTDGTTSTFSVTDGVTFTPAVNSTGVLSWTNDAGKPNPTPVDIVAAVIAALPTAVGVEF